MFRHQNISRNYEAVFLPDYLKLTLEDGVGSVPRQQRLPAITTEGQEVKTAALLVTNEALGHDGKILRRAVGREWWYPTLPR
jgi:hypothetical protein